MESIEKKKQGSVEQNDDNKKDLIKKQEKNIKVKRFVVTNLCNLITITVIFFFFFFFIAIFFYFFVPFTFRAGINRSVSSC